MAKQISPFHSADSKVYHIYGSCSSGKGVKKRKKGTSGRKLCKACKDIRAGKRTRQLIIVYNLNGKYLIPNPLLNNTSRGGFQCLIKIKIKQGKHW